MPLTATEIADVDARLDELVAVASPYWAGEHEVVQTFFSRLHTKEEHIRWLRAQCWKEFWGRLDAARNGIIGRSVDQLAELYPRLQSPELRLEFLDVARELYEEFHHYALLADILEDLEGRYVPPIELEQLPEDAKLAQMRDHIVSSEGELGAFVNKFSEGGGSSMYKAGMDISGGELEQRIAAAFRIIFDDEVGHMRKGAAGLRGTVQAPEQWEMAKRLTRDIARQRVLMRNEMFGQPLSEERLKEIDEGKIQPFHRDILTTS